MAIDISQFQTRDALSDFSLQLMNESKSFIASDVLPFKYVDKAQVKKYQYDVSMLRDVETESDSKAAAGLVDYGVFTSNMTTKLHKLAAEVDPRDEAIADKSVSDIKFDQAANIAQRLMIRMERKMVALVLNSANYPAALTATLAAGSEWTAAGGDPQGDSVTAANAIKLKCGSVPNAIAMAGTTYRLLQTSPAFKERVKYTNAGLIPDAAMLAYFGVQTLHVCDAVYNSTAINATVNNTLADIWDDSVLYFVRNPNPSLRSMSFGHTWVRKNFYSYEYIDNARGGPDGRMQMLEQGIEYEQGAGYVVSSADGDFAAGYLLKNVVA